MCFSVATLNYQRVTHAAMNNPYFVAAISIKNPWVGCTSHQLSPSTTSLYTILKKEEGAFWNFLIQEPPRRDKNLIEGSLEVKLPTIWTDEKQRWEESEKRRRKRKSQKKEDPGARKGTKVANTVFFQWFVAPEGRKEGSLKRRVRSQLAKWKMKNCIWREAHSKSKGAKHLSFGALLEVALSRKCTLLWREAHFQVKMYKTHHSRTTFGSWDVEKVHTFVARSKFPSQNVQSTPWSEHFWKLRCRKSARRCGAKHISKSKCTTHTRFGPLLEVEMAKKCTPLWREAHFEVKSAKDWRFGALLGVQMFFSWQAQGIVHLVKSEQKRGFCNISKNDGRRGTVEEDLQRCIFRGRRSTRDMFIRDARRSGVLISWEGLHFGASDLQFWEDDFAWQVQHFVWPGRRNTLDRWSGEIAKRIGTRPSALHSTFHYWRKSRRIASFLMLSTSKHEEVSQNCFVFDVVKFKHRGSRAELLRFQAYS